jgi:RNA polymerase sigma factor (sigma-70 family)
MEPGIESDPAVATVQVTAVAPAVRAQTGDAYERHSGEIYGFLVRTARDPDVAADLLSDAFTKLLVEERQGRWPTQPRAWLYRVAANLATSRGRHLQVVARVDRAIRSHDTEPHEASPDAEVLRRERRGDLDRALEQLPSDARVALLLAAQGFDGATISLTIHRSEIATRALLCRSRVRLRELMREVER